MKVRYLTAEEIKSCIISCGKERGIVDADALQRKFAKVNGLTLLDSDEYADHMKKVTDPTYNEWHNK